MNFTVSALVEQKVVHKCSDLSRTMDGTWDLLTKMHKFYQLCEPLCLYSRKLSNITINKGSCYHQFKSLHQWIILLTKQGITRLSTMTVFSILLKVKSIFLEQRLKSQLDKIRTNVLKFQRDLVDVKPSPGCKCFVLIHLLIYILSFHTIPSSAHKTIDIAAMMVSQTKEIIKILLLRVHQHGRHDIMWKPAIEWFINDIIYHTFIINWHLMKQCKLILEIMSLKQWCNIEGICVIIQLKILILDMSWLNH